MVRLLKNWKDNYKPAIIIRYIVIKMQEDFGRHLR